LVIVFSTIKPNEGGNDAVLGRELLKSFREDYLAASDKTPDNRLRLAVKNVFNDFFQKLDGLEISAASYVNGKLYATSINGGKISLYRDGFLVKILDSNTPQLVSASGLPKPGDITIVATSDFYKNLAFSEAKNILPNTSESIEEYFSMKLHNVSTASVALIKFTEGEHVEVNGTQTPLETGGEKMTSGNGVRLSIVNLGNTLRKLKRFLPRKRIYLHQEYAQVTEVKSKSMIYAGIVLSILLCVSVVFGVYKHKKEVYKSSYSDTLSEAQQSIENAVNLKSVDIIKSRDDFKKGRELLDGLIKSGIKDPEIENLTKLVSDNVSEILGEKKVESEMWLDLTLVKDGFNSKQMALSDEYVSVVDFTNGTVLTINVKSKKSTTQKIPSEVGGATFLSANLSGLYILAGDGIYDLSSKEKVIDNNWQEVTKIASYASNMYLLDAKSGEILKSTGVDKGFSESKKWTTSDKEDFSQVKSFVVDGFAWILKSGSVEKYSYGNKIKFELSNYPNELPDYDLLYTNENLDNIYLLNKSGNTVSVFNKDGEYKINIISDTVRETNDFVVSEAEKKIILLTGGKLYILPLDN